MRELVELERSTYYYVSVHRDDAVVWMRLKELLYRCGLATEST